MRTTTNLLFAILAAGAFAAASGCKKDGKGGKVITIDGSSTVFPVTQAVAEEFQAQKGGRVTVGVSGTGGGFKKFCRGETDLTGASRPIKPSELEQCKKGGVEFVELPVAYDGIAVVIHPKNDWARSLTVEELQKIWTPESEGSVTRWSDVREGFPDKKILLFAPGVSSGTYDYFTKAIVGEEQKSRTDFTSSEDDNVLVTGVAGDEGALGYFGYAYYAENTDKLEAVAIDDGDPDNGDGPIGPSPETVADGTYQPLARPIFIYVSTAAAERPLVSGFVEFYLDQGGELADEVGYIGLPGRAYELAKKRFAERETGSVFEGGSKVGVTVEELLSGGS